MDIGTHILHGCEPGALAESGLLFVQRECATMVCVCVSVHVIILQSLCLLPFSLFSHFSLW